MDSVCGGKGMYENMPFFNLLTLSLHFFLVWISYRSWSTVQIDVNALKTFEPYEF